LGQLADLPRSVPERLGHRTGHKAARAGIRQPTRAFFRMTRNQICAAAMGTKKTRIKAGFDSASD
jgi:hypothetical protein